MANNQILNFLPQAKFWNSVILDPKSTAPAAVEGGLYYNSSDGQLMYGYRESESSVIWKAVGADGSWNASVSDDASYITGISYADGSAALTTRLLPVRSLTAYDVSDGVSSVIAGPNASHDGNLYVIGRYSQDNPLVTKEAVGGIIQSLGVSDVKMDNRSVLDPTGHIATLYSDSSHPYSYGGEKSNPLATVETVTSALSGSVIDTSVDVSSNYYINNIRLSGTPAYPSLSVGTSLLPVVDARINAVGEESAGSSVVDASGVIQLKTKGHYDAADNPLVTFSEVKDLVGALRFKGSMDSSTASFVQALLASSIYPEGDTPRQGDIVIYGTAEYICRKDDASWPESAADPSYQEEYWEKFGDESDVVTSLGGKKGAIRLDENTLFIDESNTLHVKAEALGSNTYYANIDNRVDVSADTVRIEHNLNISVMNIDVYVNDGVDGSSKRMVFVDSIISDKNTITVGFGSVEAFKGCSEHGYTVVFTAAASPIKIADASVKPVVPVTPTNNE